MTTKKELLASRAQQGDCLSWGDSFFLYLEREGQPLSIASISEFEGEISVKDCVRFVESKLPLIPRYRQHVVFPPFNVGLPVWEFDPNFNVRNHVRQIKLKHGTEAEFKAACGKILSTSLDRNRPLWDLTIFRGLKNNNTGILVRVHHCLADGIAGVRLMNVLMDTVPTALPQTKPEKFDVPAPRDSGGLLLDGLFRSYFSVVERLLKVQSEIFNAAHEALSHAEKTATTPPAEAAAEQSVPGIVDMVKELATPAERLPFNQVCRGPHNIAWTEIPLADVKAIKNLFGTTVNNVLLTILTSAFRRYSELHGVNLKGRKLRIVVPVNVRGDGDPGDLGNRITFLPINVPLDIREGSKLLTAVHEKMGVYKTARVAELVSLAGTLAGTIPTMLQAIAAPLASQLPLSVCNTIITNVPGPQVPLYFIGHKMLRWYPVVPIGGEMGMNIAVLSYNGNIYVGFHGDVHAAPDVERMEELVNASFAELLKASRAKAASPTQVTRKPKARRRASAKRKTESKNEVKSAEASEIPKRMLSEPEVEAMLTEGIA